MKPIPYWTHVFDPVQVTPALGDLLASPDAPAELAGNLISIEGLLPLTFWMDRRQIASRWFSPDTHKAILASPLYREPISLALLGSIADGYEKWLRVDVVAVPALDEQVDALLALWNRWKDLPLGHIGFGRVGTQLGHHWIEVPPDLQEAVFLRTAGSLHEVAFDYLFQNFCESAFRGVLIGSDGEAAVRMLESIPGIRGESESS
ncbi:MAG: hypothetical protein EXR95_07040 [Gemmatimonadetes bacterium]|nr:hypothetical protein [Gemmatimonadota bacterium]